MAITPDTWNSMVAMTACTAPALTIGGILPGRLCYARMNDLPDNLATVLTPPGVGAIAVLAVAGPGAAAAVAGLTGRKTAFEMLRISLVKLTDNGEALDEGIVIRRAADIFEIHVHGGTAVVESILAALARYGMPAIPAEKAAGILRGCGANEHESAIAAEVLTALPGATSARSVRLLLAQRQGGLSAWAAENLQRLQQASRETPEDHFLWRISTEAQWLLVRQGTLEHLITPPRVAIIGPPNAGKSTLANMLIGHPRSITSDHPGTTRDWIDTAAQVGPAGATVQVVLVDTAGVRTTTDDPIEVQAMAGTHQQAHLADVIIFVVDGTATPDKATCNWLENLIQQSGRRFCPMILTINKSDQPMCWMGRELPGLFATIKISALMGQGLDELHHQLAGALDFLDFDPREPWVFTLRQRQIMERLTQVASARDAAAQLTELLNGSR